MPVYVGSEHVGVPLMEPRRPDPDARAVPFSLPVESAEGPVRTMVEQHHLTHFKLIRSAKPQIDNDTPESWIKRQQWKNRAKKKPKEVWNLNDAYMERLLAMEEAGAKYNAGSQDDWNNAVLFDIKKQMDEKGVPCSTVVSAFQREDVGGLIQSEFAGLLTHYNIKFSADKLSALFNDIADGKSLITLADFDASIAKAVSKGPPLGFKLSDSGRLVKMLSARLGKLQEVFYLFDPNGDGKITIEEFERGLANLHLDVPMSDIRHLLSQFDSDADGLLDYREFTDWIKGKRKARKRQQIVQLEKRLTTFAQAGSSCQLRRTPRVWDGLLTSEIEKRIIDNIGLIEKKLQEKEASRDPPVVGYVTSTQLWRVLLEQLDLKVSHDHFTYFIQQLHRQKVDGVELVEYHSFVDYFRNQDAIRRRQRKAVSKTKDRQRRKAVRNVLKRPPQTRHDSVATAVVEAIRAASWGGRLDSEIKKQRARAMAYYLDDPDIQAMDETSRPKFEKWVEESNDHRRVLARQAMQKVSECELQAKESGTHAIMLAFKAADRDEDGNTGVNGCISPVAFKDVIREICGRRMKGWNDFEGNYNVSPRQLDFCVEIAEKVPSRSQVWQYRDNQGRWHRYGPENNKIIESAKRDGKTSARIRIRDKTFKVDVDRMEQILIESASRESGPLEDYDSPCVVKCTGVPNKNAGMIRYGTFFARLAKASAQATFENFRRAGGAKRTAELGALESETRKLLGGVTFDLQQALAAKMQAMGGQDAMRIAFERFDENKDGQISPDEFRKGLIEMDVRVNGKLITVHDIDKIIEVLDQDGDGCLSYKEFVQHFGQMPKQSARDALGAMTAELQEIIRQNKTNLRKIFHAFDEDGDGSISPKELRLGLRALNIDLSANQVKDMINIMDTNQDGSLDWNEFQAIFGDTTSMLTKGVSRSYRRVIEDRQRIASQHPEIAGMRNKASNGSRSSSFASGSGISESRLASIRNTVRDKLLENRIRIIDAFRVVDTNNSKQLTMQKFGKLLRYFDPLELSITSADAKGLFEKLDHKNQGVVSLKAVQQVFR